MDVLELVVLARGVAAAFDNNALGTVKIGKTLLVPTQGGVASECWALL